VFRKRVPDVGSGDRKSSAADGRCLTGGTTRRLVPAERGALRPGTSTVEVSGQYDINQQTGICAYIAPKTKTESRAHYALVPVL